MREDIEFQGAGTTLRGWFYPGEGEAPCVVLQHGFSAVKEQRLDAYAEVFNAAGLACLVYDHPGFGASDDAPATPRREIDPWQQIRGIQDAITYAQSRADVDAGRIGLWGSSYGAGNAYVAAAIDRRIKAVCGQVPMISGRRNIELFLGAEQWAATQELLAADRLARAQGVEPARMPIVPEEPGQPAMSGSPDSIEFFQRFAETSWVNDVTVRTLEYFYGYEPADYLKRIAPTPLLMIVAPGDTVAPGEWATEAYEAALHPKKLVLVPGGHYAAYIDDEVFELSVTAARDHFVEHLMAKADISA